MNRFERLQALFEAAMDVPAPQRRAWCAANCGGDAELERELAGLLSKHEAIAQRLTANPLHLGDAALADGLHERGPSGRVGSYTLHEEIGRGGMGRVVRATRELQGVEREFAIKFVRRDVLSEATRRRFRSESRALALLDHPGIARLFEVGEAEDGTPYVVMELVRGVPLPRWCRQLSIDLDTRLKLFRDVLEAVAHAHRHLIVHRDIKPENVLVDAQGRVKLLDFGVAKALDADDVNATATAERFFTPAYAAPEQLRGEATGVGCDVYALGALLYELLSGAPPFQLEGRSAAEVERLVFVTPPPPLDRGAGMDDTERARRLGVGNAAAWRRRLRGDLDGIVLRCLRKAPGERYASVEQLDADLANYLEGRPVQARGGHGWYRARKFLRRNAVPVAVGAAVVLALLGGVAAFAWQASIARQRAGELEVVSSFQSEMLGQVPLGEAGRLLDEDVRERFAAGLRALALPEAERAARQAQFEMDWKLLNATDVARELIDNTIMKPAAQATLTRFGEQPMVEARLSQALSMRYRAMGLFQAALPLQERALKLQRERLGTDNAETIGTVGQMAALLSSLGRNTEAEGYFREALELSERVLGPDHEDTLGALGNVGFVLTTQGKMAEAEPYYRRSLASRRRVLGDDHPRTISGIHNMGGLLLSLQRYDEAEPLLQEALERRLRVLGNDDPIKLTTVNMLRKLRAAQGRYAEADKLGLESLAEHRRLLGDDHPRTMTALGFMGMLLLQQRRPDEAETYLEEALQRSRRQLGDRDYVTVNAANDWADLRIAQQRHAEADALLAEFEPHLASVFDDSSKDLVANFHRSRGRALLGLARFDDAEQRFLQSQRLYAASPVSFRDEHIACVQDLITLYQAWPAKAGEDRSAPLAHWQAELATLRTAASAGTPGSPP